MARSDPVSRGELNALARLCDQRFADQERAVLAALAAQEKLYQAGMQATATAVLKAETATERRFESVNEFRAQLGDQARSFLPRVEYDRAVRLGGAVVFGMLMAVAICAVALMFGADDGTATIAGGGFGGLAGVAANAAWRGRARRSRPRTS